MSSVAILRERGKKKLGAEGREREYASDIEAASNRIIAVRIRQPCIGETVGQLKTMGQLQSTLALSILADVDTDKKEKMTYRRSNSREKNWRESIGNEVAVEQRGRP
jgi:hypothetical protein